MMATAPMTSTSDTPVAAVHSTPLPAILAIAHTAMIGDCTSMSRPMVRNIWIWVTSLVERVIRLAVEKRFSSSGPKDSTRRNCMERRRWVKDAETRAVMKPTATVVSMAPSATASILPPATHTSCISLFGVSTSRVMSAM